MIELNLIEPSMLTASEQDHVDWIHQAITLGLAPWDPGKVTLYYSDTIGDFFEPFAPVLTIETELLPRLPFSTQLDLLTMDHHQALLKAADEAFMWFRYRHQMPVEDHIVLGTD